MSRLVTKETVLATGDKVVSTYAPTPVATWAEWVVTFVVDWLLTAGMVGGAVWTVLHFRWSYAVAVIVVFAFHNVAARYQAKLRRALDGIEQPDLDPWE